MRKIEQISISAADHERLERLVRDRNTPQKVVWRAQIVLVADDGLTAEAIAAKGVDGLKDATRPSWVKPLAPEKVKQVVHMTPNGKPPNATDLSLRSMATAAGISYCSVQRTTGSSRIWSTPSRSRATRTSPPGWRTWSASISIRRTSHWVLCADEKSQIQALDRT